MRAVVFGAGGLLGRHLAAELSRPERGLDVVALDHPACSIDDAGAVRAAVAGSDRVFNAAAFTDVDGAERDPDGAFRANAFGAEVVAREAAAAGAVVVHVSTDFVFDGAQDRPYDEFDPPSPRSLYARSKRAGEILVAKAAPRHHLVRVQALYGAGGTNFASRLAALLVARRPGMRLDRERRVQPTWARAAARAIADLAATDFHGTWHVSCGGETTWHGFASRVADRLGLPASWEPIPTAALALPAPRPANCLFSHRRLSMCGLPAMPSWEEALDAFLDETEVRR